MSCRLCLCKNMQVYYKLNNIYIDLIETVTKVKMKLNDLVCCFCIVTLRKIEKFTKTVKEVNSIFKQSIKTEENGIANSYYNLVVSVKRNIDIKCSRALYETYNCNLRDALLEQINRDLVKIEMAGITDKARQLPEDTAVDNETESENDLLSITKLITKEEENGCTGGNDKPRQLSEDSAIDNETESENDVPSITELITKEEENGCTGGKDELHQLSEDMIVDNETDSIDDVPLINESDTESENETTDANDEMHQLSEDMIVDNETDSLDDVPLINVSDTGSENETTDANDEMHQLSEDMIVDNETDSIDDLLLIYESDTGSENEYETTDANGGYILKDLKIYLKRIDEDIGLFERPREEHSGQKATSSKTNNESSNRKESELNKKYGVDTISLNNKLFSCDVCRYRSSSKRVLSRHIRAHTGGYTFKDLKICLRRIDEDIGLFERPSEEHSGKKATYSKTNKKSSNRKESKLNKKYGVDTISLNNKPFSCDVCAYRSSSKRVLSRHIRAHTEASKESYNTVVTELSCAKVKRNIIRERRNKFYNSKPNDVPLRSRGRVFACDIRN